jgi:hypothetical protein
VGSGNATLKCRWDFSGTAGRGTIERLAELAGAGGSTDLPELATSGST